MTPTSQDRHAAVNAFANRVAKYVTEEGDPEWSPYRCAVEAVTVAMQDAWYEVEAIGSPAAAPTPSPDPERPTREQIARTAYEACHGSWGDITDGLREMYLAEADAVLALFGDGASPVPQPDPPSDLSAYEDAWNAAYWSRVDDVRTIGDAPTVLVELPREVVERYARNHEDVFHPTDYPLVCAAARDALAEKEADR